MQTLMFFAKETEVCFNNFKSSWSVIYCDWLLDFNPFVCFCLSIFIFAFIRNYN